MCAKHGLRSCGMHRERRNREKSLSALSLSLLTMEFRSVTILSISSSLSLTSLVRALRKNGKFCTRPYLASLSEPTCLSVVDLTDEVVDFFFFDDLNFLQRQVCRDSRRYCKFFCDSCIARRSIFEYNKKKSSRQLQVVDVKRGGNQSNNPQRCSKRQNHRPAIAAVGGMNR